MKKHLYLLFLLLLSFTVFGQQTTTIVSKAKVTHISSQNVYVVFDNTEGIEIGDTLFLNKNGLREPVSIVTGLSSISCICKPMNNHTVTTGMEVLAKKRIENKSKIIPDDKSKTSLAVNDEAILEALKKEKEKVLQIKKDAGPQARFDGRLSVSSYTNITDTYNLNERLRYNLSLNAEHIGNSNLSAESYISFTHKLGEQINIENSLRIYNLALKYDIGKKATISVGRKINLNMANIGAVDGVQYEQRTKNFSYGALVGSRPDNKNYSFNPDLLQYGAFASHKFQNDSISTQTSIAVFNQMNNFKTDRRFAYFQHSNSLFKNLDLFCSAEVDFYSLVNMQPTNSLQLTSTYISANYKPWKKLSLSLSYDARKNLYYYETFKNLIDSFIDKETRQGFRFNTIYRPFKNVILGGTAGYRFQKSDSIPAINANGYCTLAQVPLIDASLSLNTTYLKTVYMNGMIYGASLSRDFIKGKLNAEVEYRYVNYDIKHFESPTIQNIAELSLSWRAAKKLTLSANFEATLEKDNNYGRVYVNISQRF